MSIATVSARGDFAYVYDESGRTICSVPLAGGSLQGYTNSSLSIKRGAFIYIHDERGRNIRTIPA